MTEYSTPVGSGRFRDQTRNDDGVAGLFLLLTLQGRLSFIALIFREGSFRLPWFGSGHFICNRVPKAMNTSFSILLQNGSIPPEH